MKAFFLIALMANGSIATEVAFVTERADGTVSPLGFGRTNGLASVAFVEGSLATNRVTTIYGTNQWIDGNGVFCQEALTNYVVLSESYADLWPQGGGTQAFPFATATWSGFVAQYSGSDYSAGDYVVKYIGSSTVFDDGYWVCNAPTGTITTMTCAGALIDPPGTCYLHRVIYAQRSGNLASLSDVSSATNGLISKVQGDASYAQIANGTASNLTVHGTFTMGGQVYTNIPAPDLSSRVAVTGGIATNLSARGWLALPQSAPTNLVLRLVGSNEHIYVQEVYP